jgi:hypothetical protein
VIANDEQYRITCEAAAALARDLAGVYGQARTSDPLWAATRAGLISQLDELEDQLAEYDGRQFATARAEQRVGTP